ncbi:ABC exporter membrane fusion protein, DevB family [Rivularia sp. PCC 7116]|uniref:ABC exporter membrane fusion protein n=1 Tax=Rivularia sp. PCC 7116 TaxID=373994 RepID=UPI00029EDCBB|nr:ABC exporter membrane fusion protein [Rivularia sp. PCC 7116]AFY56405.1 ABC exporter membrane fusion protein, DevB family [Rivularia sp. PCC 7116]
MKSDTATTNNSISWKPSFRQGIMLTTAAILILGGIRTFATKKSENQQSNTVAKPEVVIPQIKTVTALGRLEPKGDIVKISAPTSSQENRLQKLLVKEGDKIKAGQIIAILDSQSRLQADIVKAEEQVRIAGANLAKVKTGAKSGEISAQKAVIARLQAQLEGDIAAQKDVVTRLKAQLEGDKAAQQATIESIEAEVRNAEAEYRRYQHLYNNGAISRSNFDSKRLAMETAQKKKNEGKAVLRRINATGKKEISEAQTVLYRTQATGRNQISEAKATLDKISEIRPVDVQAAQAEVRDGMATVNQAKEKLKQAYVRSPQDGEVLEIYTRPGEVVSNNGIVEIGQTSQMYAVAEVYQTDISKVSLGQKAKVTSNSLPNELYGEVARISSKVRRQDVVNTDPSENIDAKVVEVYVKLHKASSEIASKYTNLQIEAEIEL